ncbi:MAG: phosphoserine phosphatase SerB [Hyphomicrobium sp.]
MSQPFALVLTANPKSNALNELIVQPILHLFLNKPDTKGTWLIPKAAYEIIWQAHNDQEAEEIKKDVIKSLKDHPIDANVVSADPKKRGKKLLVADMESTIIQEELIDELAAHANKKEEISALTQKTMCGEVDFSRSLLHRVKLLKGLGSEAFDSVLQHINFMPGAQSLVAKMNANKAKTALLSGGFIYFAEKISQRLGFHHYYGNVWEVHNGKLTGEVLQPLIDAEAKKKHLLALAENYNLTLQETLAVGDGANDLPMLQAAGLGVAFRSKPIVREAMRYRNTGAVIDYADLTALLALQGYGLR